MPEPLRFPPHPEQAHAEPEQRDACSTPDTAGRLSCTERTRWRISLPGRPEYWDVCHGHVADALVNVDDCYAGGQPVTVRYLG